MPGRDRTGPMGMGAMTGRAAGYCAGNGTAAGARAAGRPRRMGMGYGRGTGMGDRDVSGFGRSRRRWFSGMSWARRFGFGGGMDATAYQEPDPELERQALKRDAEALQAELEMIRKRLAQMEGDTASQ